MQFQHAVIQILKGIHFKGALLCKECFEIEEPQGQVKGTEAKT